MTKGYRNISVLNSKHFKLWTNGVLTGGDAKCDVEELLQELPDPELG